MAESPDEFKRRVFAVAFTESGHPPKDIPDCAGAFFVEVPLACLLFIPPPNVIWPEACFLSCLPVRPCVRPETLFTRYLAEYLTHFHQIYVNDALWNSD